jgi:aryl-alcohol dehydrogenase-like predicted oxidoreductase
VRKVQAPPLRRETTHRYSQGGQGKNGKLIEAHPAFGDDGPPKDRNAALAALREAVALGVNHIETSDYYGPHVTNQLIRAALHPYPDDLVIVTKVGAVRGADARGSLPSHLLTSRAPFTTISGISASMPSTWSICAS